MKRMFHVPVWLEHADKQAQDHLNIGEAQEFSKSSSIRVFPLVLTSFDVGDPAPYQPGLTAPCQDNEKSPNANRKVPLLNQ